MKQVKDLRKSFEYPLNPAYTNVNTRNTKRLKHLSEYCRQSKIPMSNNEEILMNLDLAKMKHHLFQESLTKIYDKPNTSNQDDVDQLVSLYKDFDKQGFNRFDILEILKK